MKSAVRILTGSLIALALTLTACGREAPTYSILADGETFSQGLESVNNKLDILWVIDNSGSMDTSQQNVATNFSSFISSFVSKGFDYQIAVTTTDAFLAKDQSSYNTFYNNNPFYFNGQSQAAKARFRSSSPQGNSGYEILNPLNPNIIDNFRINILQGVSGYGDERPLQSFKEALTSPLNAGFVRPDSYLAVIIVTDEDDFSHNGIGFLGGQYNHASLHTVQSYVDFLDAHTSTTGDLRRYTVSSIQIKDQACEDYLNNNTPFNGRVIAQRVKQLVDATGGVAGDLCGNFATILDDIAYDISKKSSRFFLTKKPLPSTILVKVNGAVIPNIADNTTGIPGGWTYDAGTNSILFEGLAYIPPQGATIQITFDPEFIEF